MKIRALTISNLASLRAPQQKIDFTQPPLSETGIFAIVGPTGSGKSTILDAITLALFNRVFRYGGKAPGRDIITQGETSGFVELEFELAGKIYVARWEANLEANKTAMELRQMAPEARILASGARSTPSAVEALLGLNYERMRRSMILMQGAFAEFLKAAPSKRAELLQQLTGTEIYTAVEAWVKEKVDSLTQQLLPLQTLLAELGDIREETVKHKESLLRQLQQEAAEYQAQLRQLDLKRRWWEQYQQKQAELQQLQQMLEQYRQQQQQIARDTTALSHYQKLRPHLLQFLHLFEAEQAVATISSAQQAIETEQQKYHQRIETLTAQLSHIEQQQHTSEHHLQQLQQDLQDYRALQSKLQTQRQFLQNLEQRGKTLRKELAHCNTQLQELTQHISTHRAELNQLRQWLQKHKGYETIAQQQTYYTELLQQYQHVCHTVQHLANEKARLEQELRQLTEQAEHLQQQAAHVRNELAAEEAIQQQRIEASIIHHLKATLRPGEPCPICGSTEHPAADAPVAPKPSPPDAATERIHDLREQLRSIEQQWQQITGKRQAKQAHYDQLAHTLQETHQRQTQLEQELRELQTLAQRPITRADHLLEIVQLWQHKHSELEQIEQLLETLQRQRQQLAEDCAAKEEHLRQFRQQYQTLMQEMQQTEQHIQQRWGKANPKAILRHAERRHTQLKQQAEQYRTELEQLKLKARELHTRAADLAQQQTEKQNAIAELRQALQPILEEIKIESFEAAKLILDQREILERAISELQSLQAKITHHSNAIAQLQEQLQQLHQEQPEEDLSTLTQRIAHVQQQHTLCNQRIGRLEQEIESLKTQKQKVAEAQKELQKLQQEQQQWERLLKLIGRKALVKFVQRYTLEILLERANTYLRMLHSRYVLERVPGTKEALEIQVLDNFFANHSRPIKSLSGGETFLVSIALALALADLSRQRAHIDTLFIDEGFSTLDAHHLEQLLLLLESLEGQGKKIGIISHLSMIRERFPVQIQLEPEGGRSRIRVIERGVTIPSTPSS